MRRIRLENAKKEKVDRFLAFLLLEDGVKITMQKAVGLMIDFALEPEEEIIKKLKVLVPLENPKHLGIKCSSRRIDDNIY